MERKENEKNRNVEIKEIMWKERKNNEWMRRKEARMKRK